MLAWDVVVLSLARVGQTFCLESPKLLLYQTGIPHHNQLDHTLSMIVEAPVGLWYVQMLNYVEYSLAELRFTRKTRAIPTFTKKLSFRTVTGKLRGSGQRKGSLWMTRKVLQWIKMNLSPVVTG